MNSPGFVWCQDQNPIETLKMTIRRSDGIMDVFSITRSDRPRWMTAPEFGSEDHVPLDDSGDQVRTRPNRIINRNGLSRDGVTHKAYLCSGPS